MTIRLSPEFEEDINAEIRKGRYSSVDDAMAEAARLLLKQSRQDGAGTVEGEPPPLSAEQLADQEVQQRLFAPGLLSEIKPSRRVSTGTESFTPVVIAGEPLSEIIIRERR